MAPELFATGTNKIFPGEPDMGKKMVYFFGGGKAEGMAKMKSTLGGKGANLAEMTNLGIPVPPGFTITTDTCAIYSGSGKWPAELKTQVDQNIKKLEKAMDCRLGNPDRPLLVSVRSGAAVSMPGMMDTVLNLGLNDEVVAGIIARTGNARFAYDSYRRLSICSEMLSRNRGMNLSSTLSRG